ncbi:MAG: hypothetical protein WDN69_00560 [Aliidongia sp.]
MVYQLQAGDSGLMLIPFSSATTIGAVSAGRIVAATGRYKFVPIAGLAANLIGMTLFSTVTASTPLVLTGAYMVLTGVGLGAVMPVMLIAIQNAIEVRDLGTGTASNSFFRSMGGSFGVALFGAVLIARLNGIVGMVPGHEALGPEAGMALLHAGSTALTLAPENLRPGVTAAVTQAFHDMFRVGAAISLLNFVTALFLKELPLRTTSGMTDRRAGAAAAAALAD